MFFSHFFVFFHLRKKKTQINKSPRILDGCCHIVPKATKQRKYTALGVCTGCFPCSCFRHLVLPQTGQFLQFLSYPPNVWHILAGRIATSPRFSSSCGDVLMVSEGGSSATQLLAVQPYACLQRSKLHLFPNMSGWYCSLNSFKH